MVPERRSAERLILQARRDLESAELNIGIARHEVACFLAHQAVEKRLKAAWLTCLRRAPPHSHTLLELAQPFSIPQGLGPRLAYLNLDYTVSRYPDAANGIPYEQYDEHLAREKLTTAKDAFTWLDQLDVTSSTGSGDGS